MSTETHDDAAPRFPIEVDTTATEKLNEWGGWCRVSIGTSTGPGDPEPIITVEDIEGGRLRMGLPEAWETPARS